MLLLILLFSLLLILFLFSVLYCFLWYCIKNLWSYYKCNKGSWHIKITSFFFGFCYLYFVIYSVSRNINRIGYTIDLKIYINNIKVFYNVYANFSYVVQISIFVLLFIGFILCFLFFFFVILIIVKKIKISFQEIHYILLYDNNYKNFVLFLAAFHEWLYCSSTNLKFIEYNSKTYTIYCSTILMRFLYMLPSFFFIIVIIFDIINNNFIISKYFYIVCCMPLYYLFINLFDFYTNSVLKRINDICVFICLYEKEKYKSTQFLKEIELFEFIENNNNMIIGADINFIYSEMFEFEKHMKFTSFFLAKERKLRKIYNKFIKKV